MTRTDKQVEDFINRVDNYDSIQKQDEAFLRYWIRYDLTQEQCQKLEQAKNRILK